MEKVFKKYNTSFFVNYASDPTFLTSLMTTGPYTNDTTLQVNVKRNVTDKDTKIIGEAFYNIDFQSDKSLTFLQGPYTALQTFLTKNGIKKYVVFKSGFLEQILKQPVNPTNYNKCIVERSNIKHEIVQSVIIEDKNSNRKLTFTNVNITDTTLVGPTGIPSTEYKLNFENAILTGSQHIE